jgi:CRP-like cAMP-binding protein
MSAAERMNVPQNLLLSGCPASVRDRFAAALSLVPLVPNQVLLEIDEKIDSAFFIESGLVSVIAEDCEVGLIGPEGLVGGTALLSGEARAFLRYVVHVPGQALRVAAPSLRAAAETLPALRLRLMLHLEILLAQTAQLVACNAQHALLARCARRLLMTQDRIGDSAVPITHEHLAHALAVRRSGITVTLKTLERAGFIHNARGRVEIRDHAGLETRACGCYRRIENEVGRLLALSP